MNDPPTGLIVTADEDAGGADFLTLLRMAVERPDIQPDKLETLVRVQMTVRDEGARVAFIRAMNEAQAAIMPVVRDAENKQTGSFYAKLETVDHAIRPLYTQYGFTLSFTEDVGTAGGDMVMICEVAHVAGHVKTYRLMAPPDVLGPKGAPTKTVLHGRGSTNTFLRRYLTCNVFNVVLRNRDDDGNQGSAQWLDAGQVTTIEQLLRATQTDRAQFLAWVDPAIEDVSQIQRRDYAKLHKGLLGKQARLLEAPRAPRAGG